MSGLSFLKNVSLKANSAVKAPVARAASAQSRNPTNGHIRIYKSGAAYPSEKLAASASLQYMPKDSENKGNGFDIFSSKDFLNTKHLDQAFLFIAAVPRTQGKIDLFGSTSYDENGVPKSDVLTQGATTSGERILELVKAVYGVEIPEDESYMELSIVKDSPFTTEDSIYFIPKIVSRGEKKGELDLVRREHLTLYALVPTSMLEEEEGENIEEVKEEQDDQVAEEAAETTVKTGKVTQPKLPTVKTDFNLETE